MPPITRINKNKRRGISRWRCGACLFELPSYITPGDYDMPFDSTFEQNDLFYNDGLGVKESAARGCMICRKIFQECGVKNQYNFTYWRHGLFQNDNGTCQVYLQNEPGSSPKFPLDFHPFVGVGANSSGDTRSPEAFSKARRWMQECIQRHSRCGSSFEGTKMPERVLLLEDFDTLTIKLVANTQHMPSEPYGCLSHRWGPETKESSLTREREELFQNNIPKSYFYPMIQDAIEIFHRLGLRYFWIDFLCIFQDDLNDWHRQASEMASIYTNAAITVLALHCDVEPNTRKIFSRKSLNTPTILCTHDDNTVFIRKIKFKHPLELAYVEETLVDCFGGFDTAPLFSRGWVYQEKQLSRRRLYFTETELLWDCQEAFWCECHYDEAIWQIYKSRYLGLTDFDWNDIVTQYSQTELTLQSDRLPALAGVARNYGESRNWTYLAGLWKEQLSRGLLWVPNWIVASKASGLPSWSWASTTSSVFFNDFPGEHITIIQHEVLYGPNTFGTPTSTKLHLEAPCVEASIWHYKPENSYLDDENYLVPDCDYIILKLQSDYIRFRPDYWITMVGLGSIPNGTKVTLLASDLNYTKGCFLVLKDSKDSPGHYERIGSGFGCVLDSCKQINWEKKKLVLV